MMDGKKITEKCEKFKPLLFQDHGMFIIRGFLDLRTRALKDSRFCHHYFVYDAWRNVWFSGMMNECDTHYFVLEYKDKINFEATLEKMYWKGVRFSPQAVYRVDVKKEFADGGSNYCTGERVSRR